MTDQLPDPERVLASAAKFLVEGKELDAANVLLACVLSMEVCRISEGDYRTYISSPIVCLSGSPVFLRSAYG